MSNFALLVFFLSSQAHSALPFQKEAAISFYRSPTSLFPSGQASRIELENSLKRSEFEARYQITWNKKSFHVKGTTLLRDIQVAKLVSPIGAAQLLSAKNSQSKILETLSPATTLHIVNCDEYWAEVENPKTLKKGFVPLQLLKAKNEDSGYYVSLIETYLRTSTQAGAEIITTIPRHERFTALQLKNGWIKIQYRKFTGYADINHFVSRADFANLAYHAQKKWLPISHREQDFLVTTQKERIPLKDFWGLVTSSEKAIVATYSDNDDQPPLRAHVEIKSPDFQTWGLSEIAGHGRVWWRRSPTLHSSLVSEKKNQGTLTTDELLKRKIFSLSFASKNSLKGLVSAGGVYYTEDGETWTPLDQFNDRNYPVSIHPNGAWFVGSYKSTDQGKSFNPFIRWDRLTKAIESYIHTSPRILKIVNIEPLEKSRVQIQVDTGGKLIHLRSHLQLENWEVVKSSL